MFIDQSVLELHNDRYKKKKPELWINNNILSFYIDIKKMEQKPT